MGSPNDKGQTNNKQESDMQPNPDEPSNTTKTAIPAHSKAPEGTI